MEEKKCSYRKNGVMVMKNGRMGLKELALLVYLKNMSEEKISEITRCDTHTKIGVSSDGKYDCYLSTNSGAESNLSG